MKTISAIFSGVIGAVLGFIAGSYVAYRAGLHEEVQVLGLAIAAAALAAVSAIDASTRWHSTRGRMQVALMGVGAVGLAFVFLHFTQAI